HDGLQRGRDEADVLEVAEKAEIEGQRADEPEPSRARLLGRSDAIPGEEVERDGAEQDRQEFEARGAVEEEAREKEPGVAPALRDGRVDDQPQRHENETEDGLQITAA